MFYILEKIPFSKLNINYNFKNFTTIALEICKGILNGCDILLTFICIIKVYVSSRTLHEQTWLCWLGLVLGWARRIFVCIRIKYQLLTQTRPSIFCIIKACKLFSKYTNCYDKFRCTYCRNHNFIIKYGRYNIYYIV